MDLDGTDAVDVDKKMIESKADAQIFVDLTIEETFDGSTVGSALIPQKRLAAPAASNMPIDDPILARHAGIYRLLEIYKDTGSGGLVDKIIISQPNMQRLCNDLMPSTYRSVSSINFGMLDSLKLSFVGVYGNKQSIALYLASIDAISRELFQDLLDRSTGLKTGLYVILHHSNPNNAFIVHWPEDEAFAEKAESSRNRNMISLQRYLIKLTERVVCAMTPDEIQSFDFSSLADAGDDKDERDYEDLDDLEEDFMDYATNEFTVVKDQCQKEDFVISDGFRVKDFFMKSVKSSTGVTFRPIILTSDLHQTVLIPNLVPAKMEASFTRKTVHSKQEFVNCMASSPGRGFGSNTKFAFRLSTDIDYRSFTRISDYLDALVEKERKPIIKEIEKVKSEILAGEKEIKQVSQKRAKEFKMEEDDTDDVDEANVTVPAAVNDEEIESAKSRLSELKETLSHVQNNLPSRDPFDGIVCKCEDEIKTVEKETLARKKEVSEEAERTLGILTSTAHLALQYAIWDKFGTDLLRYLFKLDGMKKISALLGAPPKNEATAETKMEVDGNKEAKDSVSTTTKLELPEFIPLMSESVEGSVADVEVVDAAKAVNEKVLPIEARGKKAFRRLEEEQSKAATACARYAIELKQSWNNLASNLEFAFKIATTVKRLKDDLDETDIALIFENVFFNVAMKKKSKTLIIDYIVSNSKTNKSVWKKLTMLFGAKDEEDEEAKAFRTELTKAAEGPELWNTAEGLVDAMKFLQYHHNEVEGVEESESLKALQSLAKQLSLLWRSSEKIKPFLPKANHMVDDNIAEINNEKNEIIRCLKKDAVDAASKCLELLFPDGVVREIQDYEWSTVKFKTITPTAEEIEYCVTELQLTATDRIQLETEEANDPTGFVPTPMPSPVSFSFNLEASYRIMKAFEFANKKIMLLCLHGQELKMFFGSAGDMDRIVVNELAVKRIPRGFDFIAYHDKDGLLVLYDEREGFINTYKFDENRNELTKRETNYCILPWYNNVLPQLANLIFPGETSEEICFIETSGRTRLFNLVTLQFRPSTVLLPAVESTIAVLRTPNGECLVSVIKKVEIVDEIMEERVPVIVDEPAEELSETRAEDTDAISEIFSQVALSQAGGDAAEEFEAENIDDEDWDLASVAAAPKEKAATRSRALEKKTHLSGKRLREPSDPVPQGVNIQMQVKKRVVKRQVQKLYCKVYFSSKLGQAEPIDVDLPDFITEEIASRLTISMVHNKQMHMIGYDEEGLLFSLLLRVTVEKNQWQFVKQSAKEIPTISIEPESVDLKFKATSGQKITTLRLGDMIRVNKEVRVVTSISKKRIQVDFPFAISASGDYEFDIVPRNVTNLLLDCWKLIYDRFPIRSVLGDSDSAEERALKSVAGGLCMAIVNVPKSQDRILKRSSQMSMSSSFMSSSFMLPPVDDVSEFGYELYTKAKSYLVHIFRTLRSQTNKDCGKLFDFASKMSIEVFQGTKRVYTSQQRDGDVIPESFPVGKWMIDMFCLLPLQIATTKTNQLLPLKDGLISRELEGLDVEGVTKKITFGWLESVFTYYGRRKMAIKVLSVMGLQSTGKSYMINHISGSHFDGNAMRCTEGIWMALAPTSDTLYVSLDFEGLGSVERSPQEDMLLSLFNAAASQLILYKTNFSLGRSMNSLFQMFQDGAKLFEKDKNDRLFKGQLFVQINDVPRNDEKDIVQEFRSKIGQIIDREGEDNFLSRLFQRKMNIEPWPLFNEADFYKKMGIVKAYAKRNQTLYNNAVEWREDIKLLLAKLMVCDWGSLDDTLISSRIVLLKNLISKALHCGLEEEEPVAEPLRCRDTGETIDDDDEQIDLTALYVEGCEPGGDSEIYRMPPDSGLKLLSDTSIPLEVVLQDFRDEFIRHLGRRQESLDDADWVKSLKIWLKTFVDRRIRRVKRFVESNLERFPAGDTRISNVRMELDKEIEKFERSLSICARHCSECELLCLERLDHEGPHHCGTDHKCHHACDYEEAHVDMPYIPKCKSKAGHKLNPSGPSHACAEASHFCGKPCLFHDRKHCQKTCSLEIGHPGDEHLCKARAHFCGEPCSLRHDDYQCSGTCVVACEDEMEHEKHHCEEKGCPIKCQIPNCTARCQSDDHFHSVFEDAVHLCGRPHRCEELCESDGICEIVTHPEVQESFVRLKHGNFQFTKQTQSGRRLPCYKTIPPNELSHEGSHSHIENDFHYCDATCPHCNYICNLPIFHHQEHNTAHGNMVQTTFACLEDDFEYDSEMYSAGDPGSAHTHIDYCRTPGGGCVDDSSIRHIHTKLNPNPEMPKDYISHALFWKRTGFQDPNTREEQELYALCDAECPGEDHKDKDKKSYCTQPLFHKPVLRTDPLPKGIGYVSVDGHHFECNIPASQKTAFHIVFVLDRSGSMALNDCRPQTNTPYYNQIASHRHINRYGATVEACCRFVDQRWGQQQNAPNAVQDTISLILFHHHSAVAFANSANISSANIMQGALSAYQADGGTNFDLAMRQAYDVIVQNWHQDRIPVVIFLSDGECQYSDAHLQSYCNDIKMRGHAMHLYTVLFSRGLTSQSLQGMATTAMSHHNNASGSASSMLGGFFPAIDEVQLSNHFVNVAQSLLKAKPSLISKR
ncbi:hypothetical protein HDU97_010206 [Phlyctochytrium planicorne]|nr:hypothetical protein HDU97_010206 [Phlyctochytrium planicorne]